ncbi:FLYWCH zinc finger domain-containing protein [Phthorimaea operculella]|nr:FLYWCH zinc finger domain-containing protein [Phthorimaea operculella]
MLIKSRKGRELLLFRKYTFRLQHKQFNKEKLRWVCSTNKKCPACVYTNSENDISTVKYEHTHQPPKYYSKFIYTPIRDGKEKCIKKENLVEDCV